MTRPTPRDDEGWGPSTAVYSSSAAGAAAARPTGRARPSYPGAAPRPQDTREDWSAAGPRPAREQRAPRAVDRRTQRSVQALQNRRTERGLAWWAALLLLIAIAAVGGLIDTLGSIDVRGGFNIGIIVASIVAIIAVQRSQMFPVVVAPPIVYSAASLFEFYVRRSTASSGAGKRQVFFDAAANYLVYGFPAIAAATAAVLIIAGIRMITRK